MGEVLHAIGVFFEQLADVKFTALALAIVCPPAEDDVHEPRVAEHDRGRRTRRSRSAGASIYASYLAGVGVNAIIPARGGDAVRLFLAHRAVPGSTYVTLGSTLLVLSFFDMAMALLIFVYALTLGVLPGVGSLGKPAGLRLRLLRREPRVLGRARRRARDLRRRSASSGLRVHIDEFKERVRQGFAVLRDRSRYLRTSRSGRRATGCSASSRSGSSSTRSGSTSRSGTSCSSR